MAEPIRPFARALFLCDYVFGYENGKTDLYGLFNVIRASEYPHVQDRFCVFAQLTGGFGDVPFFIDILFRQREELIWTTQVQRLHFPSRGFLVQMVMEIKGCPFPEPGDYLIELHCDNVCIADTPLRLLDKENDHE
jgi:hypothetical protein